MFAVATALHSITSFPGQPGIHPSALEAGTAEIEEGWEDGWEGCWGGWGKIWLQVLMSCDTVGREAGFRLSMLKMLSLNASVPKQPAK